MRPSRSCGTPAFAGDWEQQHKSDCRARVSSISVVWRSACETLAFVGSGSLPKVVWDARSSRRQGMLHRLPVPVPDSSVVRRWHWARSELPAVMDPGITVLTALRLATRRFEPYGGGRSR